MLLAIGQRLKKTRQDEHETRSLPRGTRFVLDTLRVTKTRNLPRVEEPRSVAYRVTRDFYSNRVGSPRAVTYHVSSDQNPP